MKRTMFLRVLLAVLVLITASCKGKSEPGIVLAPEVPLLKDAQSTSEAIAVLHQGDRIQVVTTKESKDKTGLQLVSAQVDGKAIVKDTPEGLRQIIEGKLHSLHDPDVYCGD